MSQFSLTFGERIRLKNELYHLRRKLDGDKWQLEKDSNGEYVVMGEAELLELYSQNLMCFVTSFMENLVDGSALETRIENIFSDYSVELQQEARRRLGFIKAIEGTAGDSAKKEIESKALILGCEPPHLSTVQRWAAVFRKSGKNICSLVPNYKDRGNRKERYSEEVVQIAFNEINKIFLNDNRNSEDETLSAIRNAIRAENRRLPEKEQLPIPRRKFLRNIIAAMDSYEVERARYGEYSAVKKFREVNTSGEIIKEPLERVEIDHTILDLIVVDEVNFLPLGRPTITVAFDRCTRSICGFHVGYDPPSYISVMKCLSHAIKPKEYLKKKYPNIENNWPCWGIMQLIVVDNGKEFHSKDLEAAALSLLIDIRYCPARKPWWKGGVERFFRTIGKSLIHTVPGTTFSNIADKGDYDSLEKAIITESDLHELLHTWICDVYHQTIHRSTLRTPSSLWRERINAVHQTLPSSVELLDVNLASIERRTLFHYGVGLNNLCYNSPVLQKLRRKKGEIMVQIRWDRSDLGAVHILDEDANVYLRIPCTWKDYASGLSLWLHKAIRKEALSHEEPESEARLDAAKARIRVMYEKALSNKKLVTRKAAARAKPSFEAEARAKPLPLAQDNGPIVQVGNIQINAADSEQIEEIPYFDVSR